MTSPGKPKDLASMQWLRAKCLNRGRGHYYEAEAEAEILASSLRDLESLISFPIMYLLFV